jgi:hypothetical protein
VSFVYLKNISNIIDEELRLARLRIEERLRPVLFYKSDIGKSPAMSQILVGRTQIRFSYENNSVVPHPKRYVWIIFEYLLVHKTICFLDCFRIFPSWQDAGKIIPSYFKLFQSLIAKLRSGLEEMGVPLRIKKVDGAVFFKSLDFSGAFPLRINVLGAEKICREAEKSLDRLDAKDIVQAIKEAVEIYPNHPAIRELLNKSLHHFSDRTPLLQFVPKVVSQVKGEYKRIATALTVMPNRLSKDEKKKFETEIGEFKQKLEQEKKEMKLLIDQFSSFMKGTPIEVINISRLEDLANRVNRIRDMVKERKEQNADFQTLCSEDLVQKLLRDEYNNQVEYMPLQDRDRIMDLIIEAFYLIITGEKIAGIDYDLDIPEEQFQILLSKQLSKAVGKLKEESSLEYGSFYNQI